MYVCNLPTEKRKKRKALWYHNEQVIMLLRFKWVIVGNFCKLIHFLWVGEALSIIKHWVESRDPVSTLGFIFVAFFERISVKFCKLTPDHD